MIITLKKKKKKPFRWCPNLPLTGTNSTLLQASDWQRDFTLAGYLTVSTWTWPNLHNNIVNTCMCPCKQCPQWKWLNNRCGEAVCLKLQTTPPHPLFPPWLIDFLYRKWEHYQGPIRGGMVIYATTSTHTHTHTSAHDLYAWNRWVCVCPPPPSLWMRESRLLFGLVRCKVTTRGPLERRSRSSHHHQSPWLSPSHPLPPATASICLDNVPPGAGRWGRACCQRQSHLKCRGWEPVIRDGASKRKTSGATLSPSIPWFICRSWTARGGSQTSNRDSYVTDLRSRTVGFRMKLVLTSSHIRPAKITSWVFFMTTKVETKKKFCFFSPSNDEYIATFFEEIIQLDRWESKDDREVQEVVGTSFWIEIDSSCTGFDWSVQRRTKNHFKGIKWKHILFPYLNSSLFIPR